MRSASMQLEWVIPWLSLCLGLSAATIVTVQDTGKIPVITVVSPSHNNQFCSTWGNYHFKTFDGNLFRLPSTCSYIFASQCKADYNSFNIELQRQESDMVTTIKKVTMKLDGEVVELGNGFIKINNEPAKIPFSRGGISVESIASYVKVQAKLGLVLMWNQEDSLWVELDAKFRNQTCGLCGDFNELNNEFTNSDTGASYCIEEYGDKWKISGLSDNCETTSFKAKESCEVPEDLCQKLKTESAFDSCQGLIETESFIDACKEDLCSCVSNDTSCVCATMSEYSRQCAHAGGTPGQWKNPDFCGKSCPFNLEYKECGNPCMDTCKNQGTNQVCSEHCVDGCFCPFGTVLDDVTHTGCITVDNCSCLHNGEIYQPGQSYSGPCKSCTCKNGEWICNLKDCPGVCSILGGSHITTYDDKTYMFHGECSYVLTKEIKGTFSLQGDLAKCEKSDKSTCLASITLLLSDHVIVKIDASGQVFYHTLLTQLPLFLDDIKIFHPSTFFLVMQTTYGLDVEIQLTPVMQVYIKASVSNKGKLVGLCGDFDNDGSQDFQTTSGIIEKTAWTFANTWKTKPNCPDVTNILGDPCSLSTEKEEYAKHWCSQLSDPKGVFSLCHPVVHPVEYQLNCIYDTCACEKSEDCLCAVLSAYVHACAIEGVLLTGWRNNTCQKYTNDCPPTFVYDYKMTSCGRTCRSLKSDLTCGVDFTELDGCGCAEGTYLNEKNECVLPSQCSCYAGDTVVHPGQVTTLSNGQTCSCYGGELTCSGKQVIQTCTSPMVFLNCSNAKPGEKGSECQKSCQTLNKQCISTDCISGCVCPDGLLSDNNGGCVKQEDCPCPYNGQYYKHGQSVKVDCNTW